MRILQTELKRIETYVLLSMISAQSAYYNRVITEGDLYASAKTISALQLEIDSRKEDALRKNNDFGV